MNFFQVNADMFQELSDLIEDRHQKLNHRMSLSRRPALQDHFTRIIPFRNDANELAAFKDQQGQHQCRPLASVDFDYFQGFFVISTLTSALGTQIDLDVVHASSSGPY
jgi:hypothetical protein